MDEFAEVYQHSKKMEGASSPISCSAAKLFFCGTEQAEGWQRGVGEEAAGAHALKNLCMYVMPLTTAALRRSRRAAMSCLFPAMSKAMFPYASGSGAAAGAVASATVVTA